MGIRIRNEVLKDTEGRIKFRKFRPDGHEHYHIEIWVDMPDRVLDRIDYVEYKLHESFRKNLRRGTSRSENFAIRIWTWGMFAIGVRVRYRDGEQDEFEYSLEYSLPADNSTNYVDMSS